MGEPVFYLGTPTHTQKSHTSETVYVSNREKCKIRTVLYYAFEAYLFQMITEGTITIEQPIRFMSKSFTGAQIRWSTIGEEACAIYFVLQSMYHILGGNN